MTDLPYLERVKIQCEILLPLYKRLRTELGEQKAAEMLRAAVREFAHDLGGKVARGVAGTSLDKMRSLMPSFKAGDALTIEPVTDNAHELTFNVRRCEYAAYFKALGETEFGAMITCEIDPPITEALGADLHLDRSQTIMRGATHCDFKWKRN
jgi:L-2-amino-thiazoline-4-carboxylic acid hydrolase